MCAPKSKNTAGSLDHMIEKIATPVDRENVHIDGMQLIQLFELSPLTSPIEIKIGGDYKIDRMSLVKLLSYAQGSRADIA